MVSGDGCTLVASGHHCKGCRGRIRDKIDFNSKVLSMLGVIFRFLESLPYPPQGVISSSIRMSLQWVMNYPNANPFAFWNRKV